jgi:hypothetical protein
MKKVLLIGIAVMIGFATVAQEKLFLTFEFMRVDNEQEAAYMETESLWQKVHEQRVKNGDIIGWDLWSLRPGGEDQGFQYLTVTLHADPVKMMDGSGFQEAFQAAFPNMTEKEENIMNATAKTRDLAVRIYGEEISTTTGEYDMPLGTIAEMDMMKVDMANYSLYEKAEDEIFKALHQKSVDADGKESWGLVRFMLPMGSDTKASHMTVNMYKNIEQRLTENINFGQGATPAQTKLMQEGIASRDMRYVYMAKLIKKVR